LSNNYKVLTNGTVIHIGTKQQFYHFNYLFNCKSICDDFDQFKPKTIIIVESNVINFNRRQVIRKTWGLKSLQDALNFRVIFLLGLPHPNLPHLNFTMSKIASEDWNYNDLIQIDVTEDYFNLTYKSIGFVKWISQHCKQVDYIFKTDDDIFLHIPNLISSFNKFLGPQDSKSIMCSKNKIMTIIRSNFWNSFKDQTFKQMRKYAVDQIPGKYYPDYCSGFGYGFTQKVSNLLLTAISTTPYFFIEDVFLTGFCRQKASALIINNPYISLRPPLSVESICSFREGRVTSQEMNEDEIEKLWTNLNTRSNICPQAIGLIKTVHEAVKTRLKPINSFLQNKSTLLDYLEINS